MSKRIIEPSGLRAQMRYTNLQDRFCDAKKSLGLYKRVSLEEMGVAWNPTVLEASGRGTINFRYSPLGGGEISGQIRDGGSCNPIVEVKNGIALINRGQMCDDYLLESLAEAIAITSKLDIQDGVEFLPSGESEPQSQLGNGGSSNPVGNDDARFQAFAEELLNAGKAIIVGRTNHQFGKYIVVETNPGWYIAYNKNYGEAPYIVNELELLLLDKQTLIKSGDAIRHRRDPRGDWVKRLREYL